MDYQVSFFQHSWRVTDTASSTASLIEDVLNTRDAAFRQLRLPASQEGKVDEISCGIWLKARTDRPQRSETTTTFSSVGDDGLHRPSPFSYGREPMAQTQIRLVQLLPGTPGSPLDARLQVVSLTSAPKYYALSHDWGNPHARESIRLGGDSFKVERITTSLHNALCGLRSSSDSILIWVDALCIDQTNTAEKNHQVRMMGTIFASAAQVVIWLGEANEDSKFGLQILQHIAEGKAFEENPPGETQPPEVTHRGLSDILNRPWFSRIWTVQEAALSSSKTVMLCSDGTFCQWTAEPSSVSLFIRGLKFAAVSAQWTENGLAGSRELGLTPIDLTGIINLLGQQLTQVLKRRGRRATALEPDLLDIAYEVKDKHCKDVRDRLFAILGLAVIRGTGNFQLEPDYSKTLQQVQEDFRRILLEAARREPEQWNRADATNGDVET